MCRILDRRLLKPEPQTLCHPRAQHAAVAADTVDITKVVLAGEARLRGSAQLDDAEKDAVVESGE